MEMHPWHKQLLLANYSTLPHKDPLPVNKKLGSTLIIKSILEIIRALCDSLGEKNSHEKFAMY